MRYFQIGWEYLQSKRGQHEVWLKVLLAQNLVHFRQAIYKGIRTYRTRNI